MKLQVIESNDESTLLQFIDTDGFVNRVVVPSSTITFDGEVVNCSIDPYEGIPYGLPWEEILDVDLTVKELANNLRRYGIWVADDLKNNPQGFRSAIAYFYGMSAAKITGAVTRFSQE